VPRPAALLLEIFSSDILPVFLVAAVGFLLARFARVDVRALSRLSLYGLAPVLMFNLLATSTISGREFGRVALLCIIVTASMGVLGRLVAIPLKLDRSTRLALLLVVMFSNGGNYGLSVALFAFAFGIFALGECLHGTVQGPLVSDLAPRRLLGRYMAMSSSSWQVGFIIGPAVGGFILQAQPFALWPVAASVCVVGAVWALALERRLPEGVRRTPVARVEPVPAEEPAALAEVPVRS